MLTAARVFFGLILALLVGMVASHGLLVLVSPLGFLLLAAAFGIGRIALNMRRGQPHR